MYIYLSISIYLSIYLYTHTHIYMNIYIYIHKVPVQDGVARGEELRRREHARREAWSRVERSLLNLRTTTTPAERLATRSSVGLRVEGVRV